jgi:integrase/recombinase XerC/integrase/recombinase XerD
MPGDPISALDHSLALPDQIAVLMRDWQAHLALQVDSGEISPATRSAYLRGWDKFWSWLEAQEPQPVDIQTIRRWTAGLRSAGIKPNSINVWLAGVRAFFAWAVSARRLASDPTAGVRGAKRKGTARGHLRQALTDAEVRRVLAIPERDKPLGRRDYAILALKAYTGLRDIELQRADLADLRTRGGRMVLSVQGKGRETKDEFAVIAHPDAEDALYDWLAARGETPGPLFFSLSNHAKGERLTLRSIRRIVKRAYRLAGVQGSGKTSHSLRHTAITSAIRHGAPLPKVQSMARHASLNTTMIYYHEIDRVEDPAEGYVDYGGERDSSGNG